MRHVVLFAALWVILLSGCQRQPAPDAPPARDEPKPEPEPVPVPREIGSAAISPDGRYVVTGENEGSVTLWDVSVEQPAETSNERPAQGVWSVRPGGEEPRQGQPPRVTFSADGKVVWTWRVSSQLIALDRATGKQVRSLQIGQQYRQEHSGFVLSDVQGALFIQGGRRFVTLHNAHPDPKYVLKVWDLGTGRCEREIPTDAEVGDLLDGRPDGNRILTVKQHCYGGSRNGNYHVVTEWDLTTGKSTHRVGENQDGQFWRGGYLPDGKRVWGDEKESVAIWDLEQGKKLKGPELRGHFQHVAFAQAGGRLAVVTDGCVQFRDPDSGRLIEPKQYSTIPADGITFFPDGQRLLIYGGREHPPECGCDNRTLFVWDCGTERLRTLAFPGGPRVSRFPPPGQP